MNEEEKLDAEEFLRKTLNPEDMLQLLQDLARKNLERRLREEEPEDW
jgi:hypothetical protein